MKYIRVFLTGLIFFILGFGVWAQDIDDEEEQQPEPAKTVQEKIVLPVQPPKPKPTPIEIQPIEPKPEQRQRFLSPQPIIVPEKGPAGLPGRQWFKAIAPVTAPQTQPFDPFSQQQFKSITPVIAPDYHNPYNPQGVSSMNFKPPSQVTGASSQYSTAILQDFKGGLNLVDFPNKIADNEATEQQNFIWTLGGKLEPRPGFDKYNTTEFDAGKRIWGLHPYYVPDTNKILLAGVNGTLWADTTYAGTGAFVSVKTGLQSNDRYYDFETFKGKTIVVHEGDYPLLLDGAMNEIAPSFGFADSFAWGSQTANRCTVTITANDVNWQDNQWAGYVLSRTNTPQNDSSTFYTPLIILSNSANELKVLTPDSGDVLLYQRQYISGFFDYDSITSCIVDSVTLTEECWQYIWTSSVTATWQGKAQLIKVVSGLSTEEERLIWVVTPGSRLVPQYPIDNLDAGDTCVILQKVFWKPRIVEIYKNRVFFVTENQYPATGQEFIVFSEYNKPTYFDPDNFFLVKTQDGDKITALATFYDDQLGYKDRSRDCLVIFKQNSIYKLVWNSATDYYLVQVAEGIGCVAPQSVVNVEGKYLLFLHTTGVYAFDGRTVTLVSAKVDPLIKDITPTQLDHVVGGYYDRHYYLTYAGPGEGYNRYTLIFNTDLGAWSNTTGIWSSLYCQQNALSDTVKLLFAHINKSFIYEFGEATTDTGEAISLVYKSKAFDFNSIADRKRFTYFDLDYYLSSGNFIAYFYTDFGDSLRYNKTVSDSGGYRYKRLPLDADCLGRNFSFKITSSNHLELGKVGLKFKKIGE